MVYEGIHIPLQDPFGQDLFGESAYGRHTGTTDLDKGQEMVAGGKAMAFSAAGLASVASFLEQDVKRLVSKAEAVKYEFAATAADSEVRKSNGQVHLLIEAEEQALAYLGMDTGARKAAQRVDAVRRGVLATSGSAAEVRASMEISRQLDARTISINTARQVSEARQNAISAMSAASSARLSAKFLRRSGTGITPHLIALGTGARAFAGSSLALAAGGK